MPTRTVSSEYVRTDLRDLLDELNADPDLRIVIERYRKPAAVLMNYDRHQELKAALAEAQPAPA